MEYDKYGRVIKSLSRMSGKTYVGPWTTWLMEYDKYNNLIKRTSYDENGKCKNIEGFGYIYAKGWDEYWMSTVYYYNSEGEITHQVDYQYEFDENGYIVKQIQTYGTYEYIYNEDGIPVKEIYRSSNGNNVCIIELICVTIVAN